MKEHMKNQCRMEKPYAIFVVKIEDSHVIDRWQEINKLADIKIIASSCTYYDANIGTSSSSLDFGRRLPRAARRVSHAQ